MSDRPEKLFFIYIAKSDEWQERQQEDWEYVSSMVRFYHWWVRRFFDYSISVEADILPVIPGKFFDRISLAYLLRDHEERGKDTYHFYLANFKPFWTDCQADGYAADNFGMIHWKRPKEQVSETTRNAFFADENCPKVSHILAHEILRQNGKKKKEYFEKVHELWQQHTEKKKPLMYFDSQFKRTNITGTYRFVTLDATEL